MQIVILIVLISDMKLLLKFFLGKTPQLGCHIDDIISEKALYPDSVTSLGQYWQRMAAVVLACTSVAIAWQWLGMPTFA